MFPDGAGDGGVASGRESASGVTEGDILRGVRYRGDGASTDEEGYYRTGDLFEIAPSRLQRELAEAKSVVPSENPDIRQRVRHMQLAVTAAQEAGDSLAQVREIAYRVRDIVRQSPLVRDTQLDWNEQVRAMRVQVDQDKARALGVTSQSLAQAARTLLSGSVVGQYREGDRLIDIVLRQPAEERNAISDIANAYVPTASGRAIPLTQIAKVSFDWEPGVLWREGRNYAVTVQGDVVEGLQGATVTAQVWPELQKLQAKMPNGYHIEVAGAVEESSKGQGSIAAGVPILAITAEPSSHSLMVVVE